MANGVNVEIIALIQQHQAEAGEHFTITTSNNYQPHLNWWGLYSPITPKKMDKTKTIIKTYDHTFTDGAIFEIEDRHAMWRLGYKITNVIEDRWQGYLQTQTVTYTLQEVK